MIKERLPWISAALLLCLRSPALAAETQPDPDRTRTALTALLESADQAIPAGSSCNGNYGNQGPARVGDLLAMQLAYLYRGKNVIKGRCRGASNARCTLTISHAFGEDMSSALIGFNLKSGKVEMETLTCVLTP